jgi:hypothetical protein
MNPQSGWLKESQPLPRQGSPRGSRGQKGDVFRVEAVLPVGQEIEVVYRPGAISIVAEQHWGTRAFNRAGEELKL